MRFIRISNEKYSKKKKEENNIEINLDKEENNLNLRFISAENQNAKSNPPKAEFDNNNKKFGDLNTNIQDFLCFLFDNNWRICYLQ